MSNANSSGSSLLHFLSNPLVTEALLDWVRAMPFEKCRDVESFCDLRDSVILSEILISIDEQYFKDLKFEGQSEAARSLWLVNLVQLKKLFLKLSAYVEVYLRQDWSLLPVPDFKLIAQAEQPSSHLNFMVAAVLLTATHGEKSIALAKFSVSESTRKQIILIEEAFFNALTLKPTNSPRRSTIKSTTENSNIDITAAIDGSRKVLFPASTSGSGYVAAASTKLVEEVLSSISQSKEFEQNVETEAVNSFETEISDSIAKAVLVAEEVPVQMIEKGVEESFKNSETSELLTISSSEIAVLKMKISELERDLEIARSRESQIEEARKMVTDVQASLSSAQDHIKSLLTQQESSHQERFALLKELHCLEDQLFTLNQDHETLKSKTEQFQSEISQLSHEKGELETEIQESTKQLEIVQDLADKMARGHEEELSKANQDNGRLVGALKKARDHIISQDKLIKDLQQALYEVSQLQKNSAVMTERIIQI